MSIKRNTTPEFQANFTLDMILIVNLSDDYVYRCIPHIIAAEFSANFTPA